MVHFQDFISKCLHHHTLFNMLSDEIFEVHHAQIFSCFNLGAWAWFIAQPIYPALWLFSPISSIVFQIVGFPQCACTHSIDLMGIHLLHCAHGNKHMRTHDAIHNTFAIIMRDCRNPNLGLTTNAKDSKVWVESEARESHFMLLGM
jgi:hypothetical protein